MIGHSGARFNIRYEPTGVTHASWNGNRSSSRHARATWMRLYVCNSLECEVNTLFEDKLEWEQHLYSRHQLAPFWICTAIRHRKNLPEFLSVTVFKHHMWNEHDGSFDNSDLRELADACQMPGRQPPRNYSLCSNTVRDAASPYPCATDYTSINRSC
jgi:hypothetical protein